jgi:outer membrane protein assembly factor BamB/DNA-binding HxlR family transcriptional regulator
MENGNEAEKDRQRAEVFDALGHPTRIAILKTLNGGAFGFADLKKKTGIESSGHLQHHLNKLDGLIKTDEYGKYCLSDQGKDALLTVQTVENASESGKKQESESRQPPRLKSRRILKLVAFLLAALLIVTSAVTILEYNQIRGLQTEIAQRDTAISQLQAQLNRDFAWEHDFGINIANLLADDGKLFVGTNSADLYCLNQNNGNTIWQQNNTGGFEGTIIADGKIFTGSRGSTLNCLDESTGQVIWTFQPPVSYSTRSPPTFAMVNGKIITTGDGLYAVDTVNGSTVWSYEWYKSAPDYVGSQGYVTADNYVFTSGLENSTWYLYKLNADDGAILWKIEMFRDPAVVVGNGRLFIWNYNEEQTILCLNETNGAAFWNYTAEALPFQPVPYAGLLLFGARNGNFYALNQTDGTLQWAYPSERQNQSSPLNFATPVPNLDQVFIGYENHTQGNEMNYQGYIASLNLTDGSLNWKTPIANPAASNSFAVSINLTLTNHHVYAVAFSDLYSINIDSGALEQTKNFTYWVLPPIYASDKLYVAADLKVTAYQ